MTRRLCSTLALCLLLAGPRLAAAQCAPGDPFYLYPPGTQTIPVVLRLVGETNGIPDPHGDCVMTVRDAANNPASNVPVTVDFSACPDIRICTSQQSGSQVVCNGTARTVTRYSDALGHVTFTIIGKSTNTGGSPGAGAGCGRVYVCGNEVANITVAVYDQNGGGVTAQDISLAYADVVSHQYFGRSDFNGDGVLNSQDLSLIYGVQVAGQSAAGCAEFTPPGSYECPPCGFEVLASQPVTVQDLRTIPDGVGGEWIAWSDNRNGNFDIFIQRIDSNAGRQFPASGLAVCTAPGDQTRPRLAQDNAGDVVLCWEDRRTQANGVDVYVQRLTGTGALAAGWPTNGVGAFVGPGDQLEPEIVPDDSTGAVVLCQDYPIFPQGELSRAARVISSGLLWFITVYNNGDHVNSPIQVDTDGSGGAVFTLHEGGGGRALYAQHVDRLSHLLWVRPGQISPLQYPPIVASDGFQPTITYDGLGGAFVAYSTLSGSYTDVYVSHVDQNGTTTDLFSSTAPFNQGSPKIVSNGPGEAFVAWSDSRNVCGTCSESDFYATRVSLTPAQCAEWTPNGVRVTDTATNRIDMSLAPDGAGGGVLVWSEGPGDIYSRHVQPNASLDSPQILCAAAGNQTAPSVAFTSAGTTIASWLDGGNGAPAGIFGQHSSFTIPTSPVVQGPFASTGGDGITQLVYDLTLVPANDRLVLVYVGSSGPAPTSVTFNGAPCSLVGQAINDMALPGTNETGCYGYLYHIKNASLPGPGTYSVAVQFGFPTNAASIASMISNADQTTPFGPVSSNLNGPPATSISTGVTACAPSLLIDMVIQDWEGPPGWVSSPPQNQRGHEVYNNSRSAITISDRSTEGGSIVSMSGSASPPLGQALAQMAVAVRPAGGGAGPAVVGVDGGPHGPSTGIVFALEGAQPNPTSDGRLMVHFSLPTGAPATLDLFDVSGRLIARRAVGSLGSGPHTVDVRPGHSLPAGIYLLRLSQGKDQRVARAVVLR